MKDMMIIIEESKFGSGNHKNHARSECAGGSTSERRIICYACDSQTKLDKYKKDDNYTVYNIPEDV